MKWTDYMTDRIFSLACFAAGAGLTGGLLWLIAVPAVFILMAEGILLTAFAVSFLWDFHRRNRYYSRLLRLLDQLDEKTLLMEIAEPPVFLDARILCDILRQNQKFLNDRIAGARRENRDYRDFLDTWVHEIKTPITSARLIIENEKNPVTLKIDDELRKIDGLTELVLYYARSSDVEKDFRVEQTSLRRLVSEALKAYSKPVIQAGGQVHMEGLDVPVCADVKSCVFIIGQIISNAVKYRQTPFRLDFSSGVTENSVSLVIRDNGIGIDAADLPRIFDKGFTGENGRRFPRSTGIGLYLCKKLCGGMNIRLSVSSEKGRGTAVTLTFPAESLIRAGSRASTLTFL